MTNVIDTLAASVKRDDIPEFRAGDTLKVHVKVVEGNRSRVQVFQGVCIRVQGSGVGRTFTVRKAKLYYLRNLRGKAAKIKEKRETSPAS